METRPKPPWWEAGIRLLFERMSSLECAYSLGQFSQQGPFVLADTLAAKAQECAFLCRIGNFVAELDEKIPVCNDIFGRSFLPQKIEGGSRFVSCFFA